MPDKTLPDQPNLQQYKKQAKDLLNAHAKAEPKSLERIAQHHPHLHKKSSEIVRTTPFHLSDAQLVIAREHGFESWPKFARHVEEMRLSREVASLDDPGS